MPKGWLGRAGICSLLPVAGLKKLAPRLSTVLSTSSRPSLSGNRRQPKIFGTLSATWGSFW
jgi:hypothetical protein